MLKAWQALLDLRTTLWFTPSVLMLVAIGLAVVAVDADTRLSADLSETFPRLFGASSEGARGMLEVIAAAMISTATLTMSITVLVLSNVSAQYAPAVIRAFMASRSTQVVLGAFLGIFAYCLVVMRTIRGGQDQFVPAIAVVFAIVLALIGVGVLVYFIHHVASSIQAPIIISGIAESTQRSIARHFPDAADSSRQTQAEDRNFSAEDVNWQPILAKSTGHLRSIDLHGLQEWAERHDLLVNMATGIGGFVCCGAPVAWVNRPLSKTMLAGFDRLHSVGNFRAVEQDPAVGLQQLVDIALKAVSPAVCNNSTALLCMNYLAAAMVELARRKLSVGADAARISIPDCEFDHYLRQVVTPLRDHLNGDPALYDGLLDMLSTIARLTGSPERSKEVLAEIGLLGQFARQQLSLPGQLARFESRIAEAEVRIASRLAQ